MANESDSPISPAIEPPKPAAGNYKQYFLFVLAPSLILPVVLSWVTSHIAAKPIIKDQVQTDEVKKQILSIASQNALVGEIRTFAFGGGRDNQNIKELRTLGWLECAGQELDRRDFPNLYQVIKGAWGSNNSGYFFNIPDLRGRFLRGWNDGAHVDDPSDRTSSGPHGAEKNNVGSMQSDAVAHHEHTLLGFGYKNLQVGPGNGTGVLADIGPTPPKVDQGSGATFATETRPKNVYVMFAIYVGKPVPDEIADGAQ